MCLLLFLVLHLRRYVKTINELIICMCTSKMRLNVQKNVQTSKYMRETIKIQEGQFKHNIEKLLFVPK